MRVFVAGATGAIGRRLIPMLVEEGHDVTGMTRSTDKTQWIRLSGATPVVADALDEQAVIAAVRQARPDVVVHQLTAISPGFDVRRFDREFTATNRLRTVGLDNLLEGASIAGCARIVAQSYAGWPYARTGGPVKTEEDPLDGSPPGGFRATLNAIRYLEATVTGITETEGIVLRYGAFYGPGTSLGEGGAQLDQVRKRRVPVIGGGGGIWSFIHIDDAARATVIAVERGRPGLYNIVDDEPASVSEWLPELARILGAKPPLRIPAWIGRLLVGKHGVSIMTEVRGASNAKAKREFGWELKWPTWREGFRTGLSAAVLPLFAPSWK